MLRKMDAAKKKKNANKEVGRVCQTPYLTHEKSLGTTSETPTNVGSESTETW